MKAIYNLRLFIIAIIAMLATSASAQDTLPVTLNFRSMGGSKTIDIAETSVNWKLSCDATWVQLTPAEGSGAAIVTITVDANAAEQEREANIMIDTGFGLVTHLFILKQKGKVSADISQVNAGTSMRSNVVTTLSGMKMRSHDLRRGIYIVNGKKVVK